MRSEFPAVAFIAAASLVLPLPWHWQARNVATLSIIFWLFVMNVIYGVDAIVWGNTVETLIPVWCDITTKLIIGSTFALPACCLCICIHLEKVASLRYAQTTLSDRKRRMIFEGVMCIGLPILFMVLHYIVQGHRFDITEEYGCRPATYYSIPSLFIVWIPPIVTAFACLIFAALALRHFMRRRASFASHLTAAQSALTASRYLRLILMSIFQMVWAITITSYTLWYTAMAIPLRPWTTWADVHSDFGRVDKFPKALLELSEQSSRAYYFLWWAIPMSTFVFVAFFAFGREAMEDYRKCWGYVRVRVLRLPETSSSKKSLFASWRKTDVKSKGTEMSLPTVSSYTYPRPPSPKKYQIEDDDDSTYLGTDATDKSLPPTPTSLDIPLSPITPISQRFSAPIDPVFVALPEHEHQQNAYFIPARK